MRPFLPFAAAATALLLIAAPAAASPLAGSKDAVDVAAALAGPGTVITGAEFVTQPAYETEDGPGDPLTGIVATSERSGFPTDGDSYAVLSSGNAARVDDPALNQSGGVNLGGENVRGNTDRDVTILRVDVTVPPGANCLAGVDFRFLSDEFPRYVNTSYNDAFILEIDESVWTTSGSTISAPNNIAFDQYGNVVSINAAGSASMSNALAAGSNYWGGAGQGGSTSLLTAQAPITAGPHSLYFSIFDQGDNILDSVVLLDNLRFSTVSDPGTECQIGVTAEPVQNIAVPAPSFDLGAHTVTIPTAADVFYLVNESPIEPGTHDVPSTEVIVSAYTSGNSVPDGANKWRAVYPDVSTTPALVTVIDPALNAAETAVVIPDAPGVTYRDAGWNPLVAGGALPLSEVPTTVNSSIDEGLGQGATSWQFPAQFDVSEAVNIPSPTIDYDAGTVTIPESEYFTYSDGTGELEPGTYPRSGQITVYFTYTADISHLLMGATYWQFTLPVPAAAVITAPDPTLSADGTSVELGDTVGIQYVVDGAGFSPGDDAPLGEFGSSVTAYSADSSLYSLSGATHWNVPLPATASITAPAPTADIATGILTIPNASGVTYLVGGTPYVAGDYAASGTTTVEVYSTESAILSGAFRWEFPFAVIEQEHIEPTAPTFTHGASELTIPAVDGVEYELNGTVAPAGTHPVSGVTQVVARAASADPDTTINGLPISLVGAIGWSHAYDVAALISVTAPAPEFIAGDDGAPNSFVIEPTVGVRYYRDNVLLAPGTVLLDSWDEEVTITATATAGYVLQGTKTWTHSFVDLVLSPTPIPSLTGTSKVGSVLTVTPGTWGPAPVAFTYAWFRNGTPIPGATASSYTLVAADLGKGVHAEVTGSKLNYPSVTQQSNPSAVIVAGTLSPAPIPSISGTAKVGVKLTATPGTWGPAPVALTYQWLRAGTAITGATASTYTPVAADSGTALTVRVTGTKAGYTTLARTSAATAAVGAGALTPAPVPTITGTAKVGVKLTATPGTWGPAPVTLTYQWLRAGTAITGATASTYTPVAADSGKALTVRVTGAKTGYATLAKTSAPTPAVAVGTLTPAPVPTIAGTPKVGVKLTATPGTWGPAPVTLTYQWLRAGTAITGATASTYTPVAADQGKTLTVRVTGTKAGYGTLSKASAATATVALGTLTPAPVPTITGTAKVGQTLTAKPGTWGPAPVTFTYQWLRGGSAITGATSATYKIVAADAGKAITVRVTGKKTGYTSLAKTSAAKTPVK